MCAVPGEGRKVEVLRERQEEEACGGRRRQRKGGQRQEWEEGRQKGRIQGFG